MKFTVLVLVVQASVVATSENYAPFPALVPNGVPTCPCIDPWENTTLVNATPACPLLSQDGTVCATRDYGARGCMPYDHGLNSVCTAREGEDPPAWCRNSWCYIDSENCARPYEPTQLFPGRSYDSDKNGSKAKLQYSYGTCGFVDAFSTGGSESFRFLREYAASRPGGRMRVAMPGDSGTGYTLVGLRNYPEPRGGPKVVPGRGVGGTNRSGAVPVFMDDLFRRAGVPWVEVPISASSRAFSPSSSFTACVHEVSIGGADLCFGNFWPTSVRRQMATFSATLYNDRFYVVVKTTSQAQTGFVASIAKPFEPFDLGLWIAMYAIFGLVGALAAWENLDEGITRWHFFSAMMPVAVLKGLNAMNHGELHDIEKKTSGSWTTSFMLGFTFQVLITGYTAVVTNRLMEEGTTEVTNLRQAIEQEYRFCANADFTSRLVATYPEIAPLLVPTPLATELAAMDREECDAAIVYEDYWRAARSFGSEAHCAWTGFKPAPLPNTPRKGPRSNPVLAGSNKARLPETVSVEANTVPVAPRLERALSFAITRSTEAGRYSSLRDEARLNYTYQTCPESPLTNAKAVLGLTDLGGPMVFLLISSVVSVFITRIGRAMNRQANLTMQAIDANGDGVITKDELSAAVRKVGLHAQHLSGTRVKGKSNADPTEAEPSQPSADGRAPAPKVETEEEVIDVELHAAASVPATTKEENLPRVVPAAPAEALRTTQSTRQKSLLSERYELAIVRSNHETGVREASASNEAPPMERRAGGDASNRPPSMAPAIGDDVSGEEHLFLSEQEIYP